MTENKDKAVPCISLLDVPIFNPLEHGIKGQPLMVPSHIFNAAASVVRRLADWSRQYPAEQIHSFSVKAKMDRELAEIEAEAKRLTSNAPALPPQRSGGRQEQIVGNYGGEHK